MKCIDSATDTKAQEHKNKEKKKKRRFGTNLGGTVPVSVGDLAQLDINPPNEFMQLKVVPNVTMRDYSIIPKI